MNRYSKAALFFAGAIGFYSVGAAIATPFADAHSSGALFQNAACTDRGTWTVELKVTATNPELAPKATILAPQSPIANAPVPYFHQFIVPAQEATFKVGVSLKWSDGFAQDLGSFTAHRPGDCTPPATTTPPTTTCAGAIPPRVDCGTPTTPPPSFATPTTIVPVVESTPQITAVPPTGFAVPSVPRASSPTPSGPASISLALPATGAMSNGLIGFGLALVLIGGTLIVVKRRGS